MLAQLGWSRADCWDLKDEWGEKRRRRAPGRRISTYKGQVGKETLTCCRNCKVLRISGEKGNLRHRRQQAGDGGRSWSKRVCSRPEQ